VLTFVALRYVDTLDAQSLYEKAARGLVKELNDPYTELFTPKQLEEFSRATNGRYAGLGMEILPVGGYVTIQKVFPNTPAESRGVQEGDRIVSIDTFNARGWSNAQAQAKLLGPPGTAVTVTFARPGVPQPIKLDFKRAEIKVPAVRYSLMIDDRVGYVPLDRFSEQTTEDISNAVNSLKAKGAKGIVIDLRGNPGGILEEAFAMSNLFLPQGQELLSVRGRAGENQKYVSQRPALARGRLFGVRVGDRCRCTAGLRSRAHPGHDVIRQGPRPERLQPGRRLCPQDHDRQVVYAVRTLHPA
jgi:carboxyl-terminal processing protease